MTPHSPAFAAALAAVEALLGPADHERARTVTPDGVRPALARWGRHEGAYLAIAEVADSLDVALCAERLNGDVRQWLAIGDATVRDACAWLGWSVPRPSRVGYDANGSPVEGA